MVYRFLKEVPSDMFVRTLSSVFFKRHTASVATETAQTVASSESKIPSFRTLENNPINHNQSHVSRFYTIQAEVKNKVYQHGGIPRPFQKQIKTFNEMCLMVRSSTVELLQYLKTADYSRPANRYIIYGETGCGKTLTLAHILHFGYVSEFILIHVPTLVLWMRNPKEVSNSATKEGFADLNMDAAAWLVHFKFQNAHLLNKLDLRLSKRYEWSKREESPEGAPLISLVDHGINRVKYASECVIALVNEIKRHSTEGRCKTLVAIDGFNSFFHPKTRVQTDARVWLHPSKISLTEAFLEITKYDWCNGAIVVTVDKHSVPKNRRESCLPVYQLSKEGFEHMDPFVPIKVCPYNESEFESCIEYYLDRRWLQNKLSGTEQGRTELKFLSAMNPLCLMETCAPL